MALKDKQLSADEQPDQRIADAIDQRLDDGMLSCPAAFSVARELTCGPGAVGHTADLLGIRLDTCQLGLFGYPSHAKGWQAAGVTALPVPPDLETALLEAGDPQGRIECLELWRLADRFGVTRMQVGYIADRLGIKVHACQLGAF